MTPESMPKKPGWFELTDGDAPSAQVTKVNKKLPTIAVVVAGAVIATGAFFSHASEPAANAEQNTVASVAPVNTTTSAATESTVNAGTANGSTTNVATVAASNTSNAVGVKAPGSGISDPTKGGVSAPSGGDDDDDDDYEDRDHHERGEHEDRD
jgi:hypothetical protein